LRRVALWKTGRAAPRGSIAVAGHPRAVERTQLVPKLCRRIGINKTAKEIGMTVAATPAHGRIREVVVYFLRLGLLGFVGPVALVRKMDRELVAERKWLTNEQMRESISICQSLPGPLAIQVGIYASYLRTGFWGAWAGGWAFIFPNFVIVAALGALYVYLSDL